MLFRSQGFDAISVHEQGARGLPDREQLESATADERALLTFNYGDFLSIAREWRTRYRVHAGIIVSYRQYSRRELGQFARTAVTLLNTLRAEDLRDAVQVLDSFRPG